jgi:CubicO group peptidase (beta-lactamase class C family)
METSAERAGFHPNRLNRITGHIQSNYIDNEKIAGCQVLVSRRGVPAYYRSFGKMDLERDKPMADDTIFRIYSMSKPITSIALMQLYEQGYFQLNDPIYRACPQFREQEVWLEGEGEAMQTRAPHSPITFRHVLNHSAGFTYGATAHPVDRVYRELGIRRTESETLADFMNNIAKVPLRYDPGAAWMYSYATDVCGGLVEAISGKPFDQYLQEHIFAPLGMTDTAFYVKDTERLAANYSRKKDKSLRLIDDPATSAYTSDPDFKSGGGGLVGTTADYYRFCEMLRRGGELDGERIIGSRTLEMMRMNHLPGNQDLTQLAIGTFSETANEGIGFGLGFATTLDQVSAGSLGPGDFYWGGAASTIFWVDPIEDLNVIFMTQFMPSNTFNFRGQLKNIVYSAIES